MGRMPEGLRKYWAKRRRGRTVTRVRTVVRTARRRYFGRKRGGRSGKRAVGIVTCLGVGAGIAKILLAPAPNYSSGTSIIQDAMKGQFVPGKLQGHLTDVTTWIMLVGVPIAGKVASKVVGPIHIGKRVKVLG